MFFCSKRTGTKLIFIRPGKPTQNALVESFNGKLLDYCLDLNWFSNLDDATEAIEGCREY
jgi:transposase InsO family protein